MAAFTTWREKNLRGCHVHSKPSRIAFQNSYAATDTYVIPQLGEGRVPLLTGKVGDVIDTRNAVPTGEADGFPTYGLQIVYDRDIQPIFNARCASCHSGASAAVGLVLNNLTIPPAFNASFDRTAPDPAYHLVVPGS